MPEIEVSEDQRDRIRELEDELEDVVVGKYGTVRPRDAIEYLLDRYEADGCIAAEIVEDNGGSVAFDEDAENGDDGATESGGDEQATDGEDGDGEEESGGDEGDEAEDDGDEADGDDEADETEDAEDGGDGDGGDPDANGGASDGGDGTDMLNAMMSLLDEHDDKWGEGSGDDRYEVELPDGETEAVRTKDDVRALLFKHYR